MIMEPAEAKEPAKVIKEKVKIKAPEEPVPIKEEEAHEEREAEVFTADTFSNLPLDPKLK